MVTKTEIADRIERSLSALLAEVDWLPNTASEWETLSDGERASTSLDWAHLIADYLTEIDEFYHMGEMTRDQQERYILLLRKLKEAQPIFERLNLSRPTVSLDVPSTTAAD